MSHILPVAELIEQVAHLAPSDYEQFFVGVQTRRRPDVPHFSKAESDILLQLQKSFSPEKWERMQVLDEKMEFESLSADEHQELLSLAKSHSRFNLTRLRLLRQLAEIRGISIDKVIEQLGAKRS